MTARDELIDRVIVREGGVKDVGDGKGLTRWGQTPGWLEQFNLPIPKTPAEAAENYSRWLDLTGLSVVIGPVADPAADFTIDFAVHSGHVAAVKVLQEAVGVMPDGKIGPKTRAAIAGMDRRLVAFAVISGEMRYQGRMITRDPAQYAPSAKGWANRNAEKLMRLV